MSALWAMPWLAVGGLCLFGAAAAVERRDWRDTTGWGLTSLLLVLIGGVVVALGGGS